MLYLYSSKTKTIKEVSKPDKFETDAFWYDLFFPEPEEIDLIERELNIRIPALEEMTEIESSSRLYQEHESLYMTCLLITSADSDSPVSSHVTFILNDKQLITVRHSDPKAFQTFYKKVPKHYKNIEIPSSFFFGLLETIVDRIADILELTGTQIEEASKEIFKKKIHANQEELRNMIIILGKKGDLCTKIRESQENLSRMISFFNGKSHVGQSKNKSHLRIDTLQQDISSIADHVAFLFNKISFLMDATLGLINIEQNAIIKIFSVAAVIFLPPTLIASVYGMNFQVMPELRWAGGYPLAIFIMIISAILPFRYFKRKGWL